MKHKLLSLTMALALLLTLLPSARAAGLTRREAAELLAAAADDYNPGIQASTLLGDSAPDAAISRADALQMLDRAFGGLPAPAGANARDAFPAESFSDVNNETKLALANVLASGIVAGTADGKLAPNAPITKEQLNRFVQRVYALKGSNLKDDFYATVNHDWLESSTIPAGRMISGSMYSVSYEVEEQVAKLIRDIADKPQKAGTAEAKIAALYHTVTDLDGRNKAGIEPIRKYVEAINAAKNLDELMEVERLMRKEMLINTLMGYTLTNDLKNSNQYRVAFGTFSPFMQKDFYASSTDEQKNAYLDFLAAIMKLLGRSDADAKADAQRIYEMEKVIAAASLDPQDQSDVDKIYNLRTQAELQTLFPNVDLDVLYEVCGLQPTDAIMVVDVGALETAATYFDDAHLDHLKAMSLMDLAQSIGSCLNEDFQNTMMDFNSAYFGVEGRQTAEQIAAQQVQSLLSDYLARAYAEAYFSAEAKADVEDMVSDFLDIYKKRIQSQDWMSDATKQKAIRKLETMGVKVGYPDKWDTCLDNARILSPDEGGTFFSNVIAVQKALLDDMISRQNKGVDKTEWIMPAFTVNACYNATANDITFPAAILQAPMYDVKASREQNLGGIGYVIAHEITHAFDNNGAKFDENGNASDWWTAEDYAAFQQKCADVVNWYDGVETVPGIACNGALTLSENVADLGSAKCIVEAASREDNPDYETLFRSMANTWASTSSRETKQYLTTADVHAPDKLRANRVLQTLDQFYKTFDIQPGDGMWTDPAGRVSIW